jgi:hypothetical protein
MKTVAKLFAAVISLLIISACAAGNIQIPEKYSLDRQLKQITSIYKYGITSWERVDTQSLILERGPGDYYLLVLKIPAPDLPFRTRIRLSSTGDMVKAGMDDVIFYNSAHMEQSYPIERIYRIDGREQMRAIRDQLTGRASGAEDDKTAQPARRGFSNGGGVDI